MFDPNIWLGGLFVNPVVQGVTLLFARCLLAFLFVMSGKKKLFNYTQTAQYMKSDGVPTWMLPFAILLELGGGLGILFGFETRLIALFMIIFNIVTALIFHHGRGDMNNLMKNLAIAGGFTYLLVFGAGLFSLDYLIYQLIY